jgi:endoglucanase
MRTGKLRRVLQTAGLSGVLLATAAASALAAGPRGLAPTTRFAVRPPDAGALQQVADLRAAGDTASASLVAQLTRIPQATWFTSGTPNEVRAKVRRTVRQAARRGTVPVLVAYFVPGRDCAQYSAGGALTQEEYLAWIDGFAQGIGNHKAVVILEPDGLGLLPSSCGGPRDGYPFTDDERFAELNGAVDRIEQQPKVSLYLDGTHSHWLAVGDIAKRLVQAGVHRAQGFFVNLSNYQPTQNLVSYATWISKCIAFAENADEGGWRLGHYDYCASQYYPANPEDYSTWHLSDEWYDANMGSAVATTHFVIDTSRNGRGANSMQLYAGAPYNQPPSVISALFGANWCNPPGSGAGLRPTANTHNALLDAYLWVKTAGESDGSCNAAGGARAWDYSLYNPWGLDASQQPLFDPLWGLFDPAAGAWFPEQALELAQLASPPLG